MDPQNFPVVTAWGKYLFPFRTEQSSPTAPMVLGPQGPGRVGRRRFNLRDYQPSPRGRLFAFQDQNPWAGRQPDPQSRVPSPPFAVVAGRLRVRALRGVRCEAPIVLGAPRSSRTLPLGRYSCGARVAGELVASRDSPAAPASSATSSPRGPHQQGGARRSNHRRGDLRTHQLLLQISHARDRSRRFAAF